jgi:hypothetical protein
LLRGTSRGNKDSGRKSCELQQSIMATIITPDVLHIFIIRPASPMTVCSSSSSSSSSSSLLQGSPLPSSPSHIEQLIQSIA